MAASKTAPVMDSLYKTAQGMWKNQEDKRQEDREKEKEIKTISSRIVNLKWINKLAKDERRKQETQLNFRSAQYTLQRAKENAAKMYRKGLQEVADGKVAIKTAAAATDDSQQTAASKTKTTAAPQAEAAPQAKAAQPQAQAQAAAQPQAKAAQPQAKAELEPVFF